MEERKVKKKKEKAQLESLIAQFKECCKDWRHLDSIIWQIPSAAAAINGILLGAFAYVSDLIVREILLLAGISITFGLMVGLVKIRYYYEVRRETAKELERQLHLKNIQRTTKPLEDETYWVEKQPKGITRFSGYSVLRTSMVIMLGLLVTLSLINTYHITMSMCPLDQKPMSVAYFTLDPPRPVKLTTVILNASRSYVPEGNIVLYIWNFGDQTVTSETSPTTAHIFSSAGNYTVTLTVVDNQWHTNSTSKLVQVLP